jgi:hypothetical protein
MFLKTLWSLGSARLWMKLNHARIRSAPIMRKVYVDVKVKLIIRVDEGIKISDVINEMDYDFTSLTDGAMIEKTEISHYDVMDSKQNP